MLSYLFIFTFLIQSSNKHGDEYLEFCEFRLFLQALRQFFEYYQAFSRLDSSPVKTIKVLLIILELTLELIEKCPGRNLLQTRWRKLLKLWVKISLILFIMLCFISGLDQLKIWMKSLTRSTKMVELRYFSMSLLTGPLPRIWILRMMLMTIKQLRFTIHC